MKKIVCEICGSQKLKKVGDLFECLDCGTQYSVEDAKKLLKEVAEGSAADSKTILLNNLHAWYELVSLIVKSYPFTHDCLLAKDYEPSGQMTFDLNKTKALSLKYKKEIDNKDFAVGYRTYSDEEWTYFMDTYLEVFYRSPTNPVDAHSHETQCPNVILNEYLKQQSVDNKIYSILNSKLQYSQFYIASIDKNTGKELTTYFKIKPFLNATHFTDCIFKLLSDNVPFDCILFKWNYQNLADGLMEVIKKCYELVEFYKKKYKEIYVLKEKYISQARECYCFAREQLATYNKAFPLSPNYQSPYALATLIEIIYFGKADSLKEALNLYDNDYESSSESRSKALDGIRKVNFDLIDDADFKKTAELVNKKLTQFVKDNDKYEKVARDVPSLKY